MKTFTKQLLMAAVMACVIGHGALESKIWLLHNYSGITVKFRIGYWGYQEDDVHLEPSQYNRWFDDGGKPVRNVWVLENNKDQKTLAGAEISESAEKAKSENIDNIILAAANANRFGVFLKNSHLSDNDKKALFNKV